MYIPTRTMRPIAMVAVVDDAFNLRIIL
jgi:hypothetical protein